MKQRPHLGTVQRLASGLDLPPGELSALFAARNLAPTPRRAADQAITVQPAPVAPLVGREQELSALTALLRDPTVWLVTLTGVGGVGKTRLALEVAHELESAFQHGAVVVPLGDVSDHRLVAQRLANVLGIKLQNERTISNSLQQREQLLVLDGFEHLLSAAPLVTAILARCPRLKILITSRVRLGIRSEREYPLQPFEAAAPHGEDLTAVTRIAPVELFRQRAVAANPEFILDEETTPIVATICSQLDGLPLAIELAAARSRVLSPQAILARLRRPLHLLTGGPSDAPGRQRTLRSSIAWSYGLLDPQAQLHFDRVSVFTGGFTLEAAASLCQRSHGADPDLATLEAVTTLVDHSLLRRVDQSNGEPRFSTLATHREFGLERLEASGETDTYRRAHATYFIDLVAQAEPELDGPHQAVWLQRLTTDLPNIRAALTWLLPHDPDRALPVLAALDHALGLPTHANETSFLLGTPIDADVNPRDRSWAPLPAGPAAMEITAGNRPKANRLITNRPELVIATRDEPCS